MRFQGLYRSHYICGFFSLRHRRNLATPPPMIENNMFANDFFSIYAVKGNWFAGFE